MISKLLNRIRTVDERDKLLTEVDLLMASLYEDNGKGFEKALLARVRFWVTEIIKEEVTNDKDQIEKYLKGLRANLENMLLMKLTLAFEPTDVSIDKFFDYVNKNIKTETKSGDFQGIILSFEYDPKILGGAEITWKGEYRDLSLRRLFEDEYEAKRGDVMKIMYSK
jgi:hypothetical protein